MVDNIIGIPLSRKKPRWTSSTPLPEDQLRQLVNLGFPVGFEDYEKSDELDELIRGKKIAFVCPSPHLKGQGQGKFIDSHDLVVRVNQSYEMPEETWDDYGRKTDILVSCLNIHKLNALKGNKDFVSSLKFILCPMVSMWDVARVDDYLRTTGIPHQNVSDGYLFKVFKEVGTTCNTGLMGIISLLNYDIESIYISGMTFFNMGELGRVYYDKYHDEAVSNNNFSHTENRQPSSSDLRMDIHNQQKQINYFHKMVYYHWNKKMLLDDYLTTNFKKTIDLACR